MSNLGERLNLVKDLQVFPLLFMSVAVHRMARVVVSSNQMHRCAGVLTDFLKEAQRVVPVRTPAHHIAQHPQR